MARITREDLEKIKNKTLDSLKLRFGDYRGRINVHMGTCGVAAGADKVMEVVQQELQKMEWYNQLIRSTMVIHILR